MKWVKKLIVYLALIIYTVFTLFLFIVMLMLGYGLFVEVFKYFKTFI